MKRFILSCGLVLSLSTSALATLYSNSTTTDVGNASGSWVATTAWTTSIPANSVAANDAMLVHINAYGGATAGLMEVKLGGYSLTWIDIPANAEVTIDLRVTRTSSSVARVTGIINDSGLGVYSVLENSVASSWTSSQNLVVEIQNSAAGGTHFRMGGVQR